MLWFKYSSTDLWFLPSILTVKLLLFWRSFCFCFFPFVFSLLDTLRFFFFVSYLFCSPLYEFFLSLPEIHWFSWIYDWMSSQILFCSFFFFRIPVRCISDVQTPSSIFLNSQSSSYFFAPLCCILHNLFWSILQFLNSLFGIFWSLYF